MKTITTGTKITFTETGDKFELIQTSTGFDVKRIKLSKNITPEPYTFQELLDLYEEGKITINGFEEGDAALAKSILTNHIHTTEIDSLKADLAKVTGEKQALEAANQQLTTENSELNTTNKELTVANEQLTTKNGELAYEIKELKALNEKITNEKEKLDTALAAMNE